MQPAWLLDRDDLAWFGDDPGNLVEASHLEPGELLTHLINRPGWMRHAACRGEDPNTFHPGPGRGQADAALAICSTCTVVDACRAWAYETEPTRYEVGVLGGMTAHQRRRQRAAHGAHRRTSDERLVNVRKILADGGGVTDVAAVEHVGERQAWRLVKLARHHEEGER